MDVMKSTDGKLSFAFPVGFRTVGETVIKPRSDLPTEVADDYIIDLLEALPTITKSIVDSASTDDSGSVVVDQLRKILDGFKNEVWREDSAMDDRVFPLEMNRMISEYMRDTFVRVTRGVQDFDTNHFIARLPIRSVLHGSRPRGIVRMTADGSEKTRWSAFPLWSFGHDDLTSPEVYVGATVDRGRDKATFNFAASVRVSREENQEADQLAAAAD